SHQMSQFAHYLASFGGKKLLMRMFALCALVVNGVAAHRISTHSIDMSGSSSIKEENQEEEARRRIDELTDFGAQAIHRGNLVRKAASLSENVSQSSTDEPATNEAIAAFDQYVAQAKKSLDQRRAETIELLKQPAGELVVSATNFHLETIKRKESTIEEQASTIKQQASIIDRLRQPSTFLWNISGQDFSAIQYNDFVESPQFGLLLGSGFWFTYFPKGVRGTNNDGWASVYLKHDRKCRVSGTLTTDFVTKKILAGTVTAESVTKTIEGYGDSWGFARFAQSPNLQAVSVNITESDC
ncbi:unnamed protein product, partial [Symbiodinium microadriaticum]